MHFSASYRLLPDLIIPLSARLIGSEQQQETVKRMYRRGFNRTSLMLVFDWTDAVPTAPPRPPLPVYDVLQYHRQRVSSGFKIATPDSPLQEFISHCPTARLSSLLLVYSPAHSPPIKVEVVVQSDSDMQLRGFRIIQPRLRCQLHSGTCSEQEAVIQGQAKSMYAVAGSEVVGECTDDVGITAGGYGWEGMVHLTLQMGVECLSSVMRMGDILTTGSEKAAALTTPSTSSASTSNATESPPSSTSLSSLSQPLSSHTILPWTLDSVLDSCLGWCHTFLHLRRQQQVRRLLMSAMMETIHSRISSGVKSVASINSMTTAFAW